MSTAPQHPTLTRTRTRTLTLTRTHTRARTRTLTPASQHLDKSHVYFGDVRLP